MGLRPAILYKDAIAQAMQRYFYTEDMLFETGGLHNWTPEIATSPDEGNYQWAITGSDDRLIGFLSYKVDFYCSKVYNFGLFSFDRGNPIIGKEVYAKLEELVRQFHRVEWRAVGGNPACKQYDKFIEKYAGTKHVFKDAIRDQHGVYHNDYLYEIVGYSPEVDDWDCK